MFNIYYIYGKIFNNFYLYSQVGANQNFKCFHTCNVHVDVFRMTNVETLLQTIAQQAHYS